MSALTFLRESMLDALRVFRPALSDRQHLIATLRWLATAQDSTQSGGVAAWYGLQGWAHPYVETTGYIINTFFDAGDLLADQQHYERALRMANFLVKAQHPLGGYMNRVDQPRNQLPVVFNTGQDLLGMTDAYQRTGLTKYLDSITKAANFLCDIQERNGSWVEYTYGHTPHVYNTRVAWALIKVYQITQDTGYLDAALANLQWAARHQLSSGWFLQNHFPPPNPPVPYTHTIAYAIEGFLWSGELLNDYQLIATAEKAALPVLEYYLRHNFLPGTFDERWQSADTYSCLTGDAQFVLIWLKLYALTHRQQYLIGAQQLLEFIKSTQSLFGLDQTVGGIKGSWPVYGDVRQGKGYCRMSYINWAAKFFADALMEKIRIQSVVDDE